MKVSINWIKEFVDLPRDLGARQLAHDLTMATVEVEDAVDLKERLDKVVIGLVRAVDKHPNADRLSVVTADLGSYGVREIVCGGTNLSAGMLTAVSMPGAKVFWHGEDKLSEISEAKVRGVQSFGMICAAEELRLADLFPETVKGGIMDLSSLEANPGDDLSSVIGYDDIIFEIDNKSLTNRPDLWGHYGLAREFAAFYGHKLKALEFPEFSVGAEDSIKVEVQDTALCPRYTAISISGVKNSESPLWLRSKLSKVGNKSHGLLVDLTNYVMLTLGEPTHVFDRAKIQGGKIVVRKAKDKESIKLLDDKVYILGPSNLVIADAEAPVALAGVMGGSESAVSNQSTEILFEAANFNAVNVRKTSAALGVRTDSSSRFEKSLDPELCSRAGRMFVSMLMQHFPKAQLRASVDVYPKKPEKKEIAVSHPFIASRLGETVTRETIIEKLSLLGFEVSSEGDLYKVKVPSWRATGDVKIPEDLVEEVARITGYDNFPSAPVEIQLSRPVFHTAYQLEKSIKLFLAEQAGYQEIYSYPWVSEEALAALNCPGGTAFLAEPPDQNTAAVRTSLLPGLVEAASRNIRFFSEAALFESGRIFDLSVDYAESQKGEKLPAQLKYFSAVRAGDDRQKLFLQMKGDLSSLFNYQNLEAEFREPAERKAAFREELEIRSQGKLIGRLGSLAKRAKRFFDIDTKEAVVFEINFEVFKELKPQTTKAVEPPKFPGVDYDLSLLFDKQVPWSEISRLIQKTDKLIEDVSFIEEFYGKQIPDGKKSIVLSIALRSPERTLTGEEVESVIKKVLESLSKKLGGELRKA